MFCPSCGRENPDSNKFCLNCGDALPQIAASGRPETGVGDSAQPPASALSPRRRRRGLLLALVGLVGVAILAVGAVAVWLLLRPGGGIDFTSSEELVLAFPNRNGEADLFLLELGQPQDEGVLLAEDAIAADRVSLQHWDLGSAFYSISGAYSAFVPGSERLLLYYREPGDDDVVIKQAVIDNGEPQEIFSTNALPLSVVTFAGREHILLSESRDNQRRCYVASPGQRTTRLTRGDYCSAIRDGSLAYQWTSDPADRESTLSLIDMSGEQEVTVLDSVKDVETSNIRISDDASHVVYLQQNDGGQQLFLVERASGVINEASSAVFAVNQFGFLPSTDLIYYLAENDDGYLDLYIGTVESPVATAYAVGTSPTRDGRYLIYTVGDEDGENTCYSYDVRNGESRAILTADNLQCIAFSELNRVLLWEVDGDEVLLYSAPIEGGDVVELFAEDGIVEANIGYLRQGTRIFLTLKDDRDDWSLFTTSVDREDGFYLLDRWHQLRLLNLANDGRRLVFWGEEDNGDDPVLISMAIEEGATLIELDDDAEAFRNAFFTPNGRDIVYTAVTGPDADDVDVIRVRADGEEPGEVLYEEAAIDAIRWGEISPFRSFPFFNWNPLRTGSSLCPGAPVLAKNNTIEGSLEEGTPACFRLTAQQGDILTFETDTSTSSSSVDTILTLRSRDGVQLAFNDDSILGRDARLTVTIDESGIYFVEVGSSQATNSGFSLSLYERTDGYSSAVQLDAEAPREGEITTSSAIYLDTLNYDNYGDLYYFEGQAGDRIAINVQAGSTGSNWNPLVYLLDESQSMLANSDSGSSGDSQLIYTLGNSGRHYVLVTGTASNFPRGENLTYQISLQQIVDGFSEAESVAVGTSVNSAVTANSVLYLADYEYNGYGHVYSFEGQSGDRVKIETRAGSIGSELNPAVYLIDSALTILAEDESDSDSLIVHTLDQSGIYYILVVDSSNRYGSSNDFKYELHIDKAQGLEALVIPIGERGVFSSAYYAEVDRVEFDSDNFYIHFESTGRSDLRRPETSCVIEQPSGRTVRLTDYDTPVRQSTNYSGVLVFSLDEIQADAEYYFRYSCRSDYSDVFLFNGSVVWP